MSYVILDLEWNSAYFKKLNRFVNEIIQIGAVKLDSHFETVDTFQVTVKSKLTKKLSGRFIQLTGITNQMMAEGSSLEEAVRLYNDWTDRDAITMTWSDSDLYAILENSTTLLADAEMLYIGKYVDLQSYVQNELKLLGHDLHNQQISLSKAAELLEISVEEFDLHTARDDSAVCALILKKTYHKDRFESLIKDAANPDFYKRIAFKPYYIANIHDERIDKAYLKFECPQCKRHIKRTKQWKYRNNWLRSEFYCTSCCMKYKGMLSFRQMYDRMIVKRRLLPVAAQEEVKASADV